MEKLLYRPEEAAEALGVGRTTVYALLASGEIESLTVGRRRLIPKDALEKFVQRSREAQAVGV